MTSRIRTLSDEELVRLLELLGGAGQCGAQAHHPEDRAQCDEHRAGVDPIEAHIRQVYFFDTPDLALDKAGVVVRARRVQNAGGDSVVKLRPVAPDKIRCAPDQAFQVAAEARPFLSTNGIGLASSQHTKTRTALDYFSRARVS